MLGDAMYELRLLETDGHVVGIYSFACRNQARARASILGVTEPYARYELWHRMDKIAEGPRFIVANGPLVPLTYLHRTAA
jgi:hypothetical protein